MATGYYVHSALDALNKISVIFGISRRSHLPNGMHESFIYLKHSTLLAIV